MKNNGFLLSVFSTLFVLTLNSVAYAEIYTWTDEDGHIHYSDNVSEAHNPEKLELNINSYRSVTVEPIESTSSKLNTTKVIMYSTAWCGYCKKARNYFKKQKIPFAEYDIEKNARAHKKYQSQGGTGSVPLILIGKQKMRGFNITSFNRLYYQ